MFLFSCHYYLYPDLFYECNSLEFSLNSLNPHSTRLDCNKVHDSEILHLEVEDIESIAYISFYFQSSACEVEDSTTQAIH